MGAVFAVPMAKANGPGELPGLRIALVPGRGVPLGELWSSAPRMRDQGSKILAEQPGDPPGELTLLLGSERDGLPAAVAEGADVIAHIPIATDSLNVAMAATVALYELANRMAAR
jgi:TrmH family RNA methyltransferase